MKRMDQRSAFRTVIAALALALIPGGSLLAQFSSRVDGVGTNAASFLEIGVGARAMALGGAYVAVANDPTALYYNPAGIVWMDNIQAEFMHNAWLVETNYDFMGATMPLPFWNSSLGMSFITLDYGEQPVRTEDRPEGNGEFYSARDFMVGLTWATALTTRFSFGITGKYIQQRIWNESGSAMAVDLGIFYATPINGLRLGMSLSNFGGELGLDGRDLDTTVDPDPNNINIDRVPVSYNTGTYPLPLLFRAGISYARDWGALGSVLLTGDLNSPGYGTENINAGVEYGYAGIFFLRAGWENWQQDDAVNGLTVGGGVDYYQPGSLGFRVDYAFSDWGILESAHRFSVGIIID